MRVSLLISLLFLLASRAEAEGYTLKRAESGALLHWRQEAVTISLHASMADRFPDGEAEAALSAAIATWSEAGAGPELIFAGWTEKEPGHRRGAPSNGVYLLDPWPYEKNLLAVTVSSFDTRTGELLDADILVNGEEDICGRGDPSRYDLSTILAHELGHLLGLGEAEMNPSATMYPRIARGDRRAVIASAADLEGIRALYQRAEIEEIEGSRLRFASAMGALSLFFALFTLFVGSRRGSLLRRLPLPAARRSAASAPDDLLELLDPFRRRGSEVLIPALGDEDIVLDADADAAVDGIAIGVDAKIEARLDGDHHARLERAGLFAFMIGADIMYIHAEIVARPVHIIRGVAPTRERFIDAPLEHAELDEPFDEESRRGEVDVVKSRALHRRLDRSLLGS